MKKNKRGDIPLTVLIIGVFAVSILAVLSFTYSTYKMNKSFVGIEIMENANFQLEKNNFEHVYLDKKITKFSLEWGNWLKEKIIFSVEYMP